MRVSLLHTNLVVVQLWGPPCGTTTSGGGRGGFPVPAPPFDDDDGGGSMRMAPNGSLLLSVGWRVRTRQRTCSRPAETWA